MLVSQEIIEDIRNRCDIVDIIGQHVQLRGNGRSFKGLCPFHQEKTPSFYVDATRQSFHCFGCGKGGDVFKFVMEKENMTFPDALHYLAGRVGVVIPEQSFRSSGNDSAKSNTRERLYEINAKFSEFFCEYLRKNSDGAAAEYLRRRGIPDEVCRQFKIGCAPDSWTAGLEFGRRCGFRDAEMLEAGVIRRYEQNGRLYDQFRNRLIFTIENENGRCVGFSARTLEAKSEDGRKYVNTGETPVFHKGKLLYALPYARQGMGLNKTAILCEGQLDAIAYHRAGMPFAVAPLGTAFTPEQARVLRRYCSKIVLSFDADGAGRKAALRAIEILLPLGVEISVLRIPGGKDPDEVFRTSGAIALREALDGAVNWFSLICDEIKERFALNSSSGKGQAAEFAGNLIALISNPVEREDVGAKLAEFLQVSANAVNNEISGIINRKNQLETRREEVRAITAAPPKKSQETVFFQELLRIALQSEEAARFLSENILPEQLPENSALTKALEIVFAAVLNGDQLSSAVSEINSLLIEQPDPLVSEVMICRDEDFTYKEKGVEAAKQTLAQLLELRSRQRVQQLLDELRDGVTAERRQELIREITEIRNSQKK